MILVKSKLVPVFAFAAIVVTACSDSTGPSNLDAVSALQSLTLGLQQVGATGTAATFDTNASFDAIAPFLNQVTVNIGGSSQTMFGLVLNETFPTGTCWETIFQNVVPTDPVACTPPPLPLDLVLWQSHSASAPPDRMAFLGGDIGTSDFSFDGANTSLPAIAIYVEGENDLWVSESGTLTSAVAATSQSCNIPLPPYAKSGSCSIATFDEQGSIVLAAFNSITGSTATGPTKTLTIPRQSLHGLLVAITEVQPIGLTATRLTPADRLPIELLRRH